MAWDGTERRAEDRKTIYQEIGELRVRLTHVETMLAEVSSIKTDVAEIKKLLQQGKGMVRMMQLLFYIVGPLVLGIIWIKDHFKA